MTPPPITDAFAKQMLRALYGLDGPMQQMDAVISALADGEAKRQLVLSLGEAMNIVLSELMVPIYTAHSHLGRASEPGPWLQDAP